MSDRKQDRHRKRPKPRACCRCGEVKAADRFPWGAKGVRRSAVCWACTEEAAWIVYHRRVLTRMTWIDPETGTVVRRCAECEEVKPRDTGFYVMQKAGKRDAKGYMVNVARYSRYCKVCHNGISRAQDRAIAADHARAERRKAQRRAASKRWRERHPERARAIGKAWKDRLRADPIRHARYLEDTRINYRLQQERAGRPVAPVSRGKRQPTTPRFLPSMPLAELVLSIFSRRQALARVLNEPEPSLKGVCEELGVTERGLRHWRTGECPKVRVGLAERVLLNAEVEWHEVYAYDDHADIFLAHVTA